MKVILTSGNRITIPKSIITELNYKQGDSFELSYDEDSKTFLLKFIDSDQTCENIQKIDSLSEENKLKKDLESSNSIIKDTLFKRKIVSNLEEGSKFSRKVYSNCELVIRTKKSYLKKFCNECKGQLVREYNLPYEKCPYLEEENRLHINKNTCKNSIQELNNNIEKLKNKINNKINDELKITNNHEIKIQTDSKNIHKDILSKTKTKFDSSTIISPVKYSDINRCNNCEEYFDKGFLLNDKFYCKKCTKESFLQFYNKYKKGMK